MSEDIRHVLSQRNSLKEWALTIRRLSSYFYEGFFWDYYGIVAHFDLKLHQMVVNTVFFNGDIEEDIYGATRQF